MSLPLTVQITAADLDFVKERFRNDSKVRVAADAKVHDAARQVELLNHARADVVNKRLENYPRMDKAEIYVVDKQMMLLAYIAVELTKDSVFRSSLRRPHLRKHQHTSSLRPALCLRDVILKEKLGAGTYGVVASAAVLPPNGGEDVAVKIITDSEARTTEINNALLQASLHHENVVGGIRLVYDSPGNGGCAVGFAMTLYPLGTLWKLQTFITKHLRRLKGDHVGYQLLRLFLDVALAILALHAKGYAHLDLKPDNICVYEQGGLLRAAVSDFGCALEFGTDLGGFAVGTPYFRAPEVLWADCHVHAKLDVHSLGAVMLCLVRGSSLRSRVAPPRGWPATDFTPHVEALASRCMEALPEYRIEMPEVAKELERLMAQSALIFLAPERAPAWMTLALTCPLLAHDRLRQRSGAAVATSSARSFISECTSLSSASTRLRCQETQEPLQSLNALLPADFFSGAADDRGPSGAAQQAVIGAEADLGAAAEPASSGASGAASVEVKDALVSELPSDPFECSQGSAPAEADLKAAAEQAASGDSDAASDEAAQAESCVPDAVPAQADPMALTARLPSDPFVLKPSCVHAEADLDVAAEQPVSGLPDAAVTQAEQVPHISLSRAPVSSGPSSCAVSITLPGMALPAQLSQLAAASGTPLAALLRHRHAPAQPARHFTAEQASMDSALLSSPADSSAAASTAASTAVHSSTARAGGSSLSALVEVGSYRKSPATTRGLARKAVRSRSSRTGGGAIAPAARRVRPWIKLAETWAKIRETCGRLVGRTDNRDRLDIKIRSITQGAYVLGMGERRWAEGNVLQRQWLYSGV